MIGVFDHVLDAEARALQLDDREGPPLAPRRTQPPQPAAGNDGHLNPALRHLLDAWSPDPAYLLDRRWDYVGFSDAADAVSDDRPRHAGACDLLREAWPL